MSRLAIQILVFVLWGIGCHAVTVLQVKGQNFLFQSGSHRAGDTLTILGADGQPKGTARVKQVGKAQSVAEILSGTVNVGDQLGLGDFAGGRETPKPATGPAQYQFSVGLLYPVSLSGKFSGDLIQADYPDPFSAEGRTGASLALSGEFRHWFNESYGMFYGFDYVMDRKLDAGLKYKLEGSATSYTWNDKYSSVILQVSFAFRLNSVFMPVGLIYTIPTYTTTGTGSVTGAIGYQVTVGAVAWKSLTVEGTYRVSNYKIRINYPTLETINFTTATVSELLLATRWLF